MCIGKGHLGQFWRQISMLKQSSIGIELKLSTNVLIIVLYTHILFAALHY